jgi:hypothetical protein
MPIVPGRIASRNCRDVMQVISSILVLAMGKILRGYSHVGFRVISSKFSSVGSPHSCRDRRSLRRARRWHYQIRERRAAARGLSASH